MSYLNFDKNQLVNLEYSLSKELIRSNRAGSFACTTIIGCNTRKYHGLLVCPIPHMNNEQHVLLSCLDETIIQRNAEFHLALHKYPGRYEPKGHKYIINYELDPTPKITYRVGGVILTKEMVLISRKERVLIRYTLVEAHSPTTLRLNPFLAFRNMHSLSKVNMYVNTHFEPVANGIRTSLYAGYPDLYLQISGENEYVAVPHWYYNIEYIEEERRGYDSHEDLYVPGFFQFEIKKGESYIFSAGQNEIDPATLHERFDKEIKDRIPRDSFENNLKNSAQQFIEIRDNETKVIAGFPWFGCWGRDTFIALPGITLGIGDVKTCKSVLDTMSGELNGALFPNVGNVYNSVDAPLWYFWAIQKYAGFTGDYDEVWKTYGKKLKQILQGYRNGSEFNIRMNENSLIWQGQEGKALTWMDAIVDGVPVTPRTGYNVEINALWYNAVCFTLELAGKFNDRDFIAEWKDLPALIRQSFEELFWDPEKMYLADYVNDTNKDWSVRPNQVFATSLPYPVVTDEIMKSVLDIVERELLTPKGLRTLAPSHPDYIGRYEGNQASRDTAYHQGTVWPWLLGHFAEGYLKLHGKSGMALITRLYNGFEEEMSRAGIGTISEVFDGDPPHNPGGAISQAWSVGEILRIRMLLNEYK
ncbi:MAG: glycogen debranching enzyme N-terminal domain-containing protein [Bacteroidia bacterium]|nr:glycogen debranching enzyme N-terminal domain-containing protein [Bacteroidia bacterium]